MSQRILRRATPLSTARALALRLTGVLLVAAALPALEVRAETQTPISPTKTLTTGTQQGTYTASNVDADDAATDGTTSQMSATSEDQVAGSGSAVAYGTETGTYANTAANDGTFHQVTAVDQFGTATGTTPTSPSKAVVKGFQSGVYSSSSVNTDDGTIDTTLVRSATNDTSPATKSPSANSGSWTSPDDAHTSNDVRATMTAQNSEGEWHGWSLSVPTHATITKVEVLLEWHASATNGCLQVRSTVDGSTWSGYSITGAAAASDRTDTLDITTQQAGWTASQVNHASNFQIGVRTNKCSGGSTPTWRLDHVQVRVTYTYSVEIAYTFTVSEPENHWTQFVVNDASAANPACDAAIYRPGATTWESLSWSLGTTEATHTKTFTTAITQYINASNEMKIRYKCTGISAPDSVAVDYLSITVTYTPYVNTRHETTYEFTTTRRPTATTVTFVDSSYRTNGNIDVHAYNWQTTSWTSVFTVTQTSETSHSSGALSGAQDYIDSSTGKLRLRYSSTTTTEATLPSSHVDYVRVTVAYDQYALDTYYEFSPTLAAASWTKIWVNDSASAPPGATAYIYDFATPGWVSLGASYTATEGSHDYLVSSNAPNHGDGSNRIRIRYAWSGLSDSTALAVDLLKVTVTGNTVPTLPTYTSTDSMASHNPAQLNDDGTDWSEVSGEVEDVNGEGDIVTIQVRLYSSFDTSTTTYSRTVTAGDRSQTLEPASVDNQVVVWNPAADNRLSFKFRHVWQTADHTNPDYYEFTAAAIDTWSATTVFSAQKITKTVEAWAEMVVNDGVANRVYDGTGTATSGSWGQWTAQPGVTLVESGSGGSQTGRYVKVENIGTGSGTVTVSWDGTAFVGEIDATWAIAIDGVLDFKHAVGSTLDPSTVGT